MNEKKLFLSELEFDELDCITAIFVKSTCQALNTRVYPVEHTNCRQTQCKFVLKSYFTHQGKYGVASLEQIFLDNNKDQNNERGARVKAVGVICTKFSGVHRHLQFLHAQVEKFVRKLGDPSELSDYFQSIRPCPEVSLQDSIILPEYQRNHPFNNFGHIIDSMGTHIFILWKYAMLGKRILFYSHPPVDVLCLNVLATHQLVQDTFKTTKTKLLFYVNVADINILENETSFIACTTEPIFAQKEKLFDLFVNNGKLVYSRHGDPNLVKLQQVSSSDKTREQSLLSLYRHKPKKSTSEAKLSGSRGSLVAASSSISLKHNTQSLDFAISAQIQQSLSILDFFNQLNTRIFETLSDLEQSKNPVLKSCKMRNKLGLSPTNDEYFIKELVRIHGFNIKVDFSKSLMDRVRDCDCCDD